MVKKNPVTYGPLKILYMLDASRFLYAMAIHFSYNTFLIPSTREEKLISLVLTDGMHIIKEKSSKALNIFYN